MSSLPLAALAATSGFQCDPRFATTAGFAKRADLPPEDPVSAAWDDGFAAGYAEAQAMAAAQAETDAGAREDLELALGRLSETQQETLRQRLFTTVELLCQAAIAPLALDADALARRIERAAAMLARADDDKVLRLHPDDLQLLAGKLPEALEVRADPSLDRGALRLETSSGGVEDGPAHWRRMICEALQQC